MPNLKTYKDPVLGKIVLADLSNVRIRLWELLMIYAILIWLDVELMELAA